MQTLPDCLATLVSRLRAGLGLAPDDLQELRAWSARCEQRLRDSQDLWQDMKGEIGRIESRIRKKKEEMESAHGMVRRMVEEEIEDLFALLDRKARQNRLLRRNANLLELGLDKIRELEHASARPLSEDQIDLLTVRLEEGIEELAAQDGAARGLAQTEYAGCSESGIDVARRMSELEDTPTGLSPRTLERLRSLASDPVVPVES